MYLSFQWPNGTANTFSAGTLLDEHTVLNRSPPETPQLMCETNSTTASM